MGYLDDCLNSFFWGQYDPCFKNKRNYQHPFGKQYDELYYNQQYCNNNLNDFYNQILKNQGININETEKKEDCIDVEFEVVEQKLLDDKGEF